MCLFVFLEERGRRKKSRVWFAEEEEGKREEEVRAGTGSDRRGIKVPFLPPNLAVERAGARGSRCLNYYFKPLERGDLGV